MASSSPATPIVTASSPWPTSGDEVLELAAGDHLALDHLRLRMILVEPALHDPEVARVRPEEEIRDRADPGDGAEQEIDADIAAHPRDMPFRHAEVARLPDDPGSHRRGDDVADHRDQIEQHVQAD